MAYTQIVIKNGQEVSSTAAEVCIVTPSAAHTRELKFFVTSGTVKVTTGRRGTQDVVGNEIHGYTTGERDFMSIDPSYDYPGDARCLFIKGVGTIIFSW